MSALPKAEWLAGLPQVVAVADTLVTDNDGLILLVKANYGRRAWQFPGGMLDPGEDPAACADRELAEETGLHCKATRLLAVTWNPSTDSSGGRSQVMFLFDGGTVSSDTSVRLQESELDEARWVSPDQAMVLLDANRAARLAAALSARDGGPVAVLVL
ncbi:NUDIX domain-containing protein [Streptomyces sp. NPDC048723]|uniref:NUDIX domain-containing protein n=1 Tax=Streptomyces sp. NPDC048723 TaxID=3365589 RepID=UPI0037183F6A